MKATLYEKGQSVIEFATLLVLVAVVILLGLTILGASIGETFISLKNSI